MFMVLSKDFKLFSSHASDLTDMLIKNHEILLVSSKMILLN